MKKLLITLSLSSFTLISVAHSHPYGGSRYFQPFDIQAAQEAQAIQEQEEILEEQEARLQALEAEQERIMEEQQNLLGEKEDSE